MGLPRLCHVIASTVGLVSRCWMLGKNSKNISAVVAQNIFPCQAVQNMQGSGHFWRDRSKKCTLLCGTKHMSKSKRRKKKGNRPLLKERKN